MKPTEYIKEEHVTDGDRYRWDLLQRMESDGWQLINEPQNRMDATLAVLELLDNIPEKNRGGHLGSHAGEIVSLVLAKFGIEEFSADDHEWSKAKISGAVMLRPGKTSAHLDDCLILKGIDVCECLRCPTCGGLPNTYDHRPGSYPDERGGLERMQMCDRYSSGKRWWRRMSDSDETMEAR